MAAITWASGSATWSSGQSWSGGSVPTIADDVFITAPGPYTVTVNTNAAANSITLAAARTTLAISEAFVAGSWVPTTLTVATTISLTAGALSLGPGGIINGGTILAQGGQFIANGGTLDGVTYLGTLTVAGGSLALVDGFTIASADGTAAGTIRMGSLKSFNSAISFLSSQTLTATVLINSFYNYFYAENAATVTIGAGTSINVGTGNFQLQTETSGSFLNFGTISVGTGGFLEVNTPLKNGGIITVNGGTMIADGRLSRAGAGAINLFNGALLAITYNLTSGGLQLIGINNASGTIMLQGAVDNTASTLIGSGGPLGDMILQDGTISNGIVIDATGGFEFDNGTLDGVAWQGTLAVGGSTITVVDGLTMSGLLGVGTGVLTIGSSGINAGTVFFETSQSVNGANVVAAGYIGSQFYADNGSTVTLGAATTLTVTGATFALSTFNTGTFANAGTISVGSGGFLDLFAPLTNAGTIICDGGDIEAYAPIIGGGGAIALSDGGVLAFNLDTTTGALRSLNIDNASGTVILGGVVTNTAATLDIGAGAGLGAVLLAFGTIQGGVVRDAAGALSFTAGTLDALTYWGQIVLADEELHVANGLTMAGATGTGNGTLTLGAGTGQAGTLIFDNSGSVFSANIAAVTVAGNTIAADNGATATLSASSKLSVSNAALELRTDDTGTFINWGSIGVGLGGGLTVSTGLKNGGNITVDAGLLQATANITALGTSKITVQNGGTVQVATNLTTAQLIAFGLSNLGGIVQLTGAVTNTGATLAVGGTNPLGVVELDGSIVGGAVRDGSGSMIFGGGTLDGVAFAGTVNVAGGALSIRNGLTVSNLGNTGGGSVVLGVANGGGGSLLARTTSTLSVGTITAVGYGGNALRAAAGVTLTLAGSLTVNAAALSLQSPADGAFVSTAGMSVTAGGTLNVAAALTNAGAITVANAVLNATQAVVSTATGSILLKVGGNFQLGYGTSTAGLLAAGITNTSGTVTVASVLDNTGAALSLGTGSSLGHIEVVGGTITGGTITDLTGSAAFSNASLTGVTYVGTLALKANMLTISGGLTMSGTPSLLLGDSAGNAGTLKLAGTQTIAGAAIIVTGLGANTLFADGGGTATMDAATRISVTSAALTLATHDSGRFVSAGTILVGTGASLTVGAALVNQGSIIITGGKVTFAAAVTNLGVISIASATVTVNTPLLIDPAGTLTLGLNGTLAIGYNLATAALAQVGNTGGLITFGGTVDNTGSTLSVGTGNSLGTARLDGTIVGGVIADGGSGLSFGGNARLDGVTYRGTMKTTTGTLTIVNGLTLAGTAGTGLGQITLGSVQLFTSQSQTWSNATVRLSAGAAAVLKVNSRSVLTLDKINMSLGNGTLTVLSDTTGTIVDNGNITLSANGTLALQSAFTANGSVSITAGRLSADVNMLTNFAGQTLQSGTWNISGKGVLSFTSSSGMAVLGANLTVTGLTAAVQVVVNGTPVAMETTLRTITTTGQLHLLGGRSLNLTAGLNVFGQLEVTTGSTLVSSGLTVGASGYMYGATATSGGCTNDGTIEARSGLLKFAGRVASINGGTLLIGQGGTLQIATSGVISNTIVFGVGTFLILDQPNQAQVPISGLAAGDSIDLKGFSASSVTFTPTLLTVTSGKTTLSWTLLNTTAGSVTFGADAGTGTMLRFGAAAPVTAQNTQSANAAFMTQAPAWDATGTVLSGLVGALDSTLLSGLSAGDSINLTDFAFVPGAITPIWEQHGDLGVLTLDGAGQHTELTLSGTFAPDAFTVQANGSGGTLVSLHTT